MNRRLAFRWVAVLAALNIAMIVLRLWIHRMDTEDLWSPTPAGWPSEQREPRQEGATLGGAMLEWGRAEVKGGDVVR